mmetsp:Transcript_20432/g.38244  ORF Transcript_20432/g.38244 Transcript_20432/m.38244 type:complete len:579 (-) Transcript_20432:2297-4033(-)
MFSRFLRSSPYLTRNFAIDHRTLRKLNRDLQFERVIEEYERANIASATEKIKCQQQYLFALKYFPKITAPDPALAQPAKGTTDQDPLIVKEVVKADSSKLLVLTFETVALVLFVGVALSMTLASRGTAIIENKSHTKAVTTSEVTFNDVRGIDECKAELQEIVSFLKDPGIYTSRGAKLPRGVLLTGVPGTGKTLLAKAIAGEAGVKFFYSSGSDFEELFVGLGAKRIRELFETAKQNAPCVVFIDEIDALGGSRSNRDMNYNRQSLNQLLVELDGFSARDNIVVIAATNFPESLDKALTRAGRFDKTIEIPLPDVKGREDILDLYLSKVNHDDTVNKEIMAKLTFGMTGADLANVINISILHALKLGNTLMTMEDFNYAKDRIVIGVERTSRGISEEDKLKIAIHEIGHALTGTLTDGCQPVYKTTILPKGDKIGVTITIPDHEIHNQTRKSTLALIDMAMGGRVAEEMFYSTTHLTLSCQDDMKSASDRAYRIIRSGIFDEYSIHASPRLLQTEEGEEQRNAVDRAVNDMMTKSYERVKQLLLANKDLVDFIASHLQKRETMTGEEIKELINQFRS